MKLFFWRLGVWLWFNSRLWAAWSRVYRLIQEQKFLKMTTVAIYMKMADLVKFKKPLIWTADGGLQLWDATSYPEKVQWIADHGDKKIGDCDEFAIYTIAALNKSLAAGLWNDPRYKIKSVHLLTVMWIAGTNKSGGHNVCLVELDTEFPNKWCYMDYDYPRTPRPSIADVAAQVREDYVGKGNISLGWAVSKEDLSLVEFGL